MIVRRLGQTIDTEDMSNNHLYTYISTEYTLNKVEVNFELKDIKNFLTEIIKFSTEKRERVSNIEYDFLRKWPVEKKPYDKILEFFPERNSIMEPETLLTKPIIKDAYLTWLEYPSIHDEIKKLVDFKCSENIGLEKSIDLTYYLDELDKYGIKDDFLSIINLSIVDTIDKEKLSELNKFRDNGFINLNKQIENANTYLEYGSRNASLIKKIR